MYLKNSGRISRLAIFAAALLFSGITQGVEPAAEGVGNDVQEVGKEAGSEDKSAYLASLREQLLMERELVEQLEIHAKKVDRSVAEARARLEALKNKAPSSGSFKEQVEELAEKMAADIAEFRSNLPPTSELYERLAIEREIEAVLESLKARQDQVGEGIATVLESVQEAFEAAGRDVEIKDHIIDVDEGKMRAKVLRVGQVAWFAQLQSGELRMWDFESHAWVIPGEMAEKAIKDLFGKVSKGQGAIGPDTVVLPLQVQEVAL